MKRFGLCFVAIAICISFIATSACSVEISDADADGVIEVGETITFIGDDYIIESDGDVHIFTEWSWDFDGDFVIDAYGKTVTHIYDQEGYYRGYLYEKGDVGYTYTMEIEVYIDNGIAIKTKDVSAKGPGHAKAWGWYEKDDPKNGKHHGITGK